ncbi:hypothetical protein [Streptomyces sp. NPDC051219]|uniref:hypothetical protein n=1 Tax=Streptomyces sp. NPDC051219 TaxID=3155283 RepID=UPI00342C4D2D
MPTLDQSTTTASSTIHSSKTPRLGLTGPRQADDARGRRTLRAEGNCRGYPHQFGSNATRAERSVEDVDFSTDLMRLATGGGSH